MKCEECGCWCEMVTLGGCSGMVIKIQPDGPRHACSAHQDAVEKRVADGVMECGCDPNDRTGGGHDPRCPEFEHECTCYEMTGGHQPGCYYNRRGTQAGEVARG